MALGNLPGAVVNDTDNSSSNSNSSNSKEDSNSNSKSNGNGNSISNREPQTPCTRVLAAARSMSDTVYPAPNIINK